jgi:hypothetical protein
MKPSTCQKPSETFQTLVARDLLKIRESGFAKADAQFFKMIGGMPSGPEPLQNALDFM